MLKRSQRNLLALFGGLSLLLLASALVYMAGMTLLEERPRDFWRAFTWAAETITTTGYGADHTWAHPAMVVFVALLQFAGVFLIFLIFPVYLIPALEERFQGRLPERAPDVEDAVFVYRYGPAVANLVEELERAGVETVICESDEATARRLLEREKKVLYTTMDDGFLDRIDLGRIRAIVANGGDDANATLALAARQSGYEGEILALAEDPQHRKALTVAGATRVFTPKHILAAAIAARASDRISPRIVGAQALGRKLVVNEIKIGPSSPLAGRTLKDADVGRRTGVTVIGQWRRGELMAPVPPDTRLEAGSILVVAGSSDHVEGFADTCTAGGVRLGRPLFVAGYGEVGRTVAEMLSDVGEEVVTLDERELDGVDIVGDIANHRVLESSGLRDARAAILAVGSDSATLFAILVVKEFAPHVPIIARVNEARNVERTHRAGADFVLSISQVSGQLLAARLLGRESITVDPQLKVTKVSSGGLAGQHPTELAIRERTGTSIIAVERGDEVLVSLEPELVFEEGDVLYVCGGEEAVQKFIDTFPVSTDGILTETPSSEHGETAA